MKTVFEKETCNIIYTLVYCSPVLHSFSCLSLYSHCILWIVCVCTQSCPSLCDAMDCSLPGSSVHGILQARILEWVVIPFSGDLPLPGIEPASLMFFTTCTTWEAFYSNKFYLNIRLYIPLALFYFSRCQKLG